MHLFLPALLALVPASSAFYPYLSPDSGNDSHSRRDLQQRLEPIQREQRSVPDHASNPSPRTISKPREVDPKHVRMSLHKLPVKRSNRFTILRGANPSQANSVAVDQDGTDFSYFTSFKFGTSSNEYFMLLDSAAANTWVMSSDCTTSACNIHNTFGLGDSTSLEVTQTAFKVAYGTGNVQGITGSDQAHVGSMSVPLIFGLAQNVSNEFSSFPMDGIVGLGRADLLTDTANDIQGPSLLDELVSQKIITSKMFGISLWRDSDGGTNNGEINFGAPDSSRYTGDLNYMPAVTNTNGFWEIAIDDAGMDGSTLGLGGRTAIIDSGTSYILVPPDDADTIHSVLPGSTLIGTGQWTVPCDSTGQIQIRFGGKAYNISPKDYIGAAASTGCLSNIIGRQTFGSKQWLVGDVFLKNVYTVFDFDGQRVGLGVKVASSPSPSATTSPSSPGTPSSHPASSVESPSSTSTPSYLALICFLRRHTFPIFC